MRFSLSSLLTLAAAATAVVAHPSKRGLSLNPPKDFLREVKWEELAPAPIMPVTNSKRFAQGLPPLRPRRRNPHGGVVHARQGTRVASAPRSETSPVPPSSAKCHILVKIAATGESLGYVSPNWNDFAEYGPLQNTQDGALQVAFSYSSDSAKQLDLMVTNAKSAAYPFLGASAGYGSSDENIGSGNPNYLVLTGNTQIPPGSTPSYEAGNSFSEKTSIPVASESAIWSYDTASGDFTAWWVNTDGSSAQGYILWSNQEDNDLFTMTGDPAIFKETYGVDSPEVTFTCVPPVTTPV
ncbi:hypothetical protein OPQ81_000362 [Rhizoctonia solani]|nr:hypothetical protein OPQ81_000362 [Rhizoctonia solani]